VPRSQWNAVASAIAVAGALICVYAVRQVDPDFWGYLDAGRLFAAHGVTSHDPFAYTTSHSAWITFEYGAELVHRLAENGDADQIPALETEA